MFAAGNNDFMVTAQDRGFTLLELMIVILVIALTAAVIYPSLSRGSSTLHMRACSRDVLNYFRYAREKAVTEQTSMVVLVDKENQGLILSNNLGDNAKTYVMPKDVKIGCIGLSGNELTDSSMGIRFLPNGSSDAAVVLLKSDSGAQVRIISDALTGGARFESAQGTDLPCPETNLR
jgi:general secretion pathway protein H